MSSSVTLVKKTTTQTFTLSVLQKKAKDELFGSDSAHLFLKNRDTFTATQLILLDMHEPELQPAFCPSDDAGLGSVPALSFQDLCPRQKAAGFTLTRQTERQRTGRSASPRLPPGGSRELKNAEVPGLSSSSSPSDR